LREDGSPYYIGKGKGDRAYRKGSREFDPPKDKQRILFLKKDLTEEEAFSHEVYMISVYGRKDLGTGILRNQTNGGEGGWGQIPWNKGMKMSPEFCKKISESSKGRPKTEEHKRKIGESNIGHIAWNKGRNTCPNHQKETNRKMMLERYNNGSLDQKGENNFNAKEWIIEYKDGKVIRIKSLQSWAKEQGYSKGGLRNLTIGKWKRYRDLVSIKKVN
jgi:hypothetical protein